MSLPSFSFGAEGVEYGRKASFYELSSGPVVLPSDLEVKGNLLVDGSTILTGPAVVNSNLTVSGNETVGGDVTVLGGTGGIGLTVGQSGAPRDLVVTGTAFTGLINSSTVTATQGGTGGTAGLVVTNAGIGGNPLRSVSVFNDQASPGTLISMRNGADAGTLAYDGSQFQLSRPLTIPVQPGSLGRLFVGGSIYGADQSTPAEFSSGARITYPSRTRSGIDDPFLDWDVSRVPGVGYKQDGPGTVYIPDDWQTDLTLPTGLMATFISYGVGNSTCNAITRVGGVVAQTTGSRTTPNVSYFYLLRSQNGINNTIVYLVVQGVATGATIPQ